MRALRLLYSNLDNLFLPFVLISTIGFIDGVNSFIIPAFLAEYTKGGYSTDNLAKLPLTLVAIYLFSLFLQWILRRYGEALGPKLSIMLRLKYFRAAEELPVSSLLAHHSGYVLSLVNRVADGLGGLVVEIFWGVSRTIAVLGLFLYFSLRESTLVAALNIAVLTVFVWGSTVLARKMVPLVNEQNHRHARLLERYVDFMANVLTVKRLGISSFAEAKLLDRTRESYQAVEELQGFHAFRWLALHSLFGVAYLGTIAILLYQISENRLPVSVLILFIAAYSLVRGNAERLSENLKTLFDLGAYIRRLDTIVRLGESNPTDVDALEWNSITMNDVRFTHSGSEATIFIPHFSLKPGEMVNISGESGEGKSTFLNLFAGFYKPMSGERKIDEQSYEALGMSDLRSMTAVISQEVELFDMSLRENIALGAEISASELEGYLAQLGLLDWIKSLEKGLDSPVGEKGIRISAGQRQRINLLRGILLNRDIYLLDEPTSHLDQKSESLVLQFLLKKLKGKSAIVVTHSQALQALCGAKYVFQNHVLKRES